MAEAAAGVALLGTLAESSAIASSVAASVAAPHATAHSASTRSAVASDVAQTAALVALLAGCSGLGGTILSHMARLIAAVAYTVSFASGAGGSRVARLWAVAREVARLLAVVAKRVVAGWTVTSLVTGFSAYARG